jgi:hypothetical protein
MCRANGGSRRSSISERLVWRLFSFLLSYALAPFTSTGTGDLKHLEMDRNFEFREDIRDAFESH